MIKLLKAIKELTNGILIKPSHMHKQSKAQSVAGTMTIDQSTQSVEKKDAHI